MKFRFFKGDETREPLRTIKSDWFALREERDIKLKAIFDTIPFYDSWYGGETYIRGIACKADNPALEQAKAEKGYKVTQSDGMCIIEPNRRYKAGKALSETLGKIARILKENPDFSDYALKQLKLSCWVLTGTRCYQAVAGAVDDTFIVKIPVKEEGYGGDKFPVIPDCLTEIKESEFLAIQGE